MANKIEIPLKTVNKLEEKRLPSNFKSIIEAEYAVRYLESFGANPTRENLDFVEKQSSISSAVLLPVWTKDTLVILPNCDQDPDSIDLQEVFKTDIVGSEVLHKASDDSLFKDRNRRNQTLSRKLSYKEIIERDSAEYVPVAKIKWSTEHNGESLRPLIKRLSVADIRDQRFLRGMIPLRFDEEVMISGIQSFSESLKSFAPMLRRDLEGKVSPNLIRMLSSAKFLQFYGTLFQSCQNIFGDIVSISLEELKLNDEKSYNSAIVFIQSLPEFSQRIVKDFQKEIMDILSLYNQCVESLNEKVRLLTLLFAEFI